MSEEVKDKDIKSEEKKEKASDISDQKEKHRSFGSWLCEILIYVAIVILCITVVPRYVIQRTIVDGPSMMDTLQNRDNLIVEKISYRFKDPERFDVIVFYPHGRNKNEYSLKNMLGLAKDEEKSDYYIKRIIGLPGEKIKIEGDTIYINGKVLEENYGKDPMTYAGIVSEERTLGKDEYFVLGDNRKVSEDSRYEEVGFVKRENIDGHAVLRIKPLSKFGTFD